MQIYQISERTNMSSPLRCEEKDEDQQWYLKPWKKK
jgi:hypothetical protein